MIGKRHVVSLCVCLLCMLPACGNELSTAFADSTFTLSSNPTKMVLHVYVIGGLSGEFHSMSLYGDGRLVLKEGKRKQTLQEYTKRLSLPEMRELVSLATNHGLAEWDGMAFRAKALEINEGKPLVVPDDSPRLRINLALEHYERDALALTSPVNVHQRVVPFLSQILIEINADRFWDMVFVDDFEDGTTGQWDATVQ